MPSNCLRAPAKSPLRYACTPSARRWCCSWSARFHRVPCAGGGAGAADACACTSPIQGSRPTASTAASTARRRKASSASSMTGGSSQKPSSRHCLPSPGRCDAVPSRASRTPSARRSLSSAAMRA
ncbi:hypothetical protein G6F68_017632 [Rhizopus microsporus]|nr:hypothetical protein G6F24_016064 [Rhizopus arrhizus]KAG1240468.1 hypothetical protein G6F68_017632 [Rhizopus microsporus]